MKALIDLGEPFTSLESTGDNNPHGTIPLLLLVSVHSWIDSANCQTGDKIALILSRGANAKARDSQGETCLHLVFSKHHHHSERGCWCENEAGQHYFSETKDIVIMMISAGADVCAIDEQGKSVSDAAINSGLRQIWIEALKCCGIDIKDVLARPKVNPAHSTALSTQYNRQIRSVASKISLAEYLKGRKASSTGYFWRNENREFSSSDDDDESEDGESESENEDWAEEESKSIETKRKESVEENEYIHPKYEESIPRGKAKLD